MSAHDHPDQHRCTRCGNRCAAKRLTDLGPVAGTICRRCLDEVPSAERRALLRKAVR